MKRALTLAGSIVLICLAVAACGTGRKRLTSGEYTQLVAQQKALSKAVVRFPFESLLAGCRTAGAASGLIKAARTACVADAVEMSAEAYLGRYGCPVPGATPTTVELNGNLGLMVPDPSLSVRQYAAELVCLNPGYQKLARAAVAAYAADLKLHRELLARGLPRRCVRAIGPDPGTLKNEPPFIAAIRKFADDTELITKVADRQAPARHVVISKIEADEATMNRTYNAILNDAHTFIYDLWRHLSVCPH